MTSIGKLALYECTSLLNVTIPYSMVSIGESAFSGNSLTNVFYTGTKGQWNEISIGSNNDSLENASIHYNTKFNLDEKTGVIVSVSDDTFAEDLSPVLSVTPLTDSDQTDISITAEAIYEIHYEDEKGNIVSQAEGSPVIVMIPVPEEANGEQHYVYSKDKDGSLTDIDASLANGHLLFTATDLGTYVISAEKLSDYILGDVTGDNELTTADALMVLKAATSGIELTPEQILAADVNKDGEITTADALKILKAATGSGVIE